MNSRLQLTFAALIVTQVAHSVEEYLGRLWESFPPAEFITGLISQDRREGFLLINILFVGFGVWCFVWPVLQKWKIAIGLAWLWACIESINGIGHLLWSLSQFRYSPGVLTSPLLLMFALYMVVQLTPKFST